MKSGDLSAKPRRKAPSAATAKPAPNEAPASFARKALLWFAGLWTWLRPQPRQLWDHLRPMPQAAWQRVRAWPRWLQAVLSATILLIGALLIFLAQPNWDWARPFVKSIIAGKVHRAVRIDGHLRVHLFSLTPDATLGGLKIGQPDWVATKAPVKDSMADIGLISVKAELLPLFVGHIVLPRLQIDQPALTLIQDARGRANWDFSDGRNPAPPTKLPPIKDFIINDGHLTLTSEQRHMRFTGTVNAHEKADAGRTAFQLAGNGSLNGRVFELTATGGPLLNVKSSVPYPFDAQVRAGDTRLAARGQVTHPFNLGQVQAAVTVKGRDLYDLYYLTGLSFPNTPAYSLAAKVTRNNRVYTIDAINGRVGGSDLEGALKVDTRNNGRPYLTGDLASRSLNFRDLGSLVGATDANKPAPPKLSAAPQATVGARRLLPDASLDVDRVRGMDADVRYHAASVQTLNNMPLRQVHLGVHLDHGLLTLDPIDFTLPHGQLIGTARIDARGSQQSNTVDMRLTDLSLQDYIPKIGGTAPAEGQLDARLRATGGGNSVHKAAASANGRLTVVMPGGAIRQSFAELMGVDATKGLFLLLSKDKHETDVRCAVADFDIRNGVMQARTIVFDTGVVVVNGAGRIDLNDESLKLVFKGKPKKFRLVRVDVPIIVGGHLTAPAFGVKAGPAIAQTGLAALLHTLVPFVSLGTGKDADCAGLTAQARAAGAQ